MCDAVRDPCVQDGDGHHIEALLAITSLDLFLFNCMTFEAKQVIARSLLLFRLSGLLAPLCSREWWRPSCCWPEIGVWLCLVLSFMHELDIHFREPRAYWRLALTTQGEVTLFANSKRRFPNYTTNQNVMVYFLTFMCVKSFLQLWCLNHINIFIVTCWGFVKSLFKKNN